MTPAPGSARTPRGRGDRNVRFDSVVHFDSGTTARVAPAAPTPTPPRRAMSARIRRGAPGNTPRGPPPAHEWDAGVSSPSRTETSFDRLASATTGEDGSFDGLRTITRRSMSATTRPSMQRGGGLSDMIMADAESPIRGTATFPVVAPRSTGSTRQTRRNIIAPEIAYGGYEERQRARQERAAALRSQRGRHDDSVF
jgi:hypothetical protein